MSLRNRERTVFTFISDRSYPAHDHSRQSHLAIGIPRADNRMAFEFAEALLRLLDAVNRFRELMGSSLRQKIRPPVSGKFSFPKAAKINEEHRLVGVTRQISAQ